MEDLASVNPGQMGWGVADDDRFEAEKYLGEMFRNHDPFMYARRPAKSVMDSAAFAAIEAIQQANGIDGGVWLCAIEQYLFGKWLDWKAQIVGSCVGSSFMRGAALRTMWESFVLGDPEEIWGTRHVGVNNVAPFGPYGYRAGRRLGGLNRGDGSYCSVQIRGAKEWGILPCSAVGLYEEVGGRDENLPEPQSASMYREWGNSNSLLEKYAPQAKAFVLNESEKVVDATQAKTLICDHWKPLQICSMWAFEPDSVHPTWTLDGGEKVVIYRRSRASWAHAMLITGVVRVGQVWYAIVKNSWGMQAHKNGDWFAIPLDLLDRWLRDAECMSIGDIELTNNVLPVA